MQDSHNVNFDKLLAKAKTQAKPAQRFMAPLAIRADRAGITPEEQKEAEDSGQIADLEEIITERMSKHKPNRCIPGTFHNWCL